MVSASTTAFCIGSVMMLGWSAVPAHGLQTARATPGLRAGSASWKTASIGEDPLSADFWKDMVAPAKRYGYTEPEEEEEGPAPTITLNNSVTFDDFKKVARMYFDGLKQTEALEKEQGLAVSSKVVAEREVLRKMFSGEEGEMASTASPTGSPVLDMIVILVDSMKEQGDHYRGVVAEKDKFITEQTANHTQALKDKDANHTQALKDQLDTFDKEKSAILTAQKKTIARIESEHATELDDQKAACHAAAEAAKAEHDKIVEDLEESHASDIRAEKSKCKAELAIKDGAYAAAMLKREEEVMADIATASAKAAADQAAAVAAEGERCKSEIEDLKETHDSEIEAKEAAHEKAMVDAKAAHEVAITDAETVLSEKCEKQKAIIKENAANKALAKAKAHEEKDKKREEAHKKALDSAKDTCDGEKETLTKGCDTRVKDLKVSSEKDLAAAVSREKASCDSEAAELSKKHVEAEKKFKEKLETCESKGSKTKGKFPLCPSVDATAPDSAVWDIPSSFSSGIKCSSGDLQVQGNNAMMRWKKAEVFDGWKFVGTYTKDSGCDDHLIVFSTSDSERWSWGSSGNAVKFVWNCNSKYIYPKSGEDSAKNAACSKNAEYKITIDINDGVAKFSDDQGCGELTAKVPFLKSKAYMYVGADNDMEGTPAAWHSLTYYREGEAGPAMAGDMPVLCTESGAAPDSSVWDVPSKFSSAIKCSAGNLMVQGNDAMMRWKEAQNFDGWKFVGSYTKDSSCDDHLVVLSTSESEAWRWGSSGSAVKFVWNCNSKYIYPKSGEDGAKSVSCSESAMYKVTIEIKDGMARFSDDRGCDTLIAKVPFLKGAKAYMYVGADNDMEGTPAEWHSLEAKSFGAGVIKPVEGQLKTRDSDKCLDRHMGTNNLYMHPCHGGNNQKWWFDGEQLKTRDSGNCMDRHMGDNNVFMHPCHGGNNQKWWFDGEQLKTRDSSWCLDRHMGDDNVFMHPCHGGNNQKWFFD